jgi:hypothetical protein
VDVEGAATSGDECNVLMAWTIAPFSGRWEFCGVKGLASLPVICNLEVGGVCPVGRLLNDIQRW